MEVGPYHAERLSTLDAVFLDLEDACHPMHMAALLVFEAKDLRTTAGTLDVDRIARHVNAHLTHLPRYRQRLRRVPLVQHPVWVDDPDFDVRAHVRALTLTPPGDTGRLQDLVSDLLGQRLPRTTPPWEMYVVDGLEGDRFAVLAKVHHCIGDGVLGMAALASLLRPEPGEEEALRSPHTAQPAPPTVQLFREELGHRVRLTAALLRRARSWLSRPTEGGKQLRAFARGSTAHARALRPASVTPLNLPRLGPRRRVQWAGVNLHEVEAIKERMGCTVNDVVLAVIAGAVRRHVIADGADPAKLLFRVMVPVSRRGGRPDASAADGNRMSLIVAPLPVGEPDPLRRLERTAATMDAHKAGGQVESLEVMEELAELGISPLLAWITHRLLRLRPVNVVVTNLVGPRTPLYLLRARCLEAYPFIPLLGTVGVAVAVFSYGGRLGMGINADGHAARPEAFRRNVEEAFDELATAVFGEVGEARSATSSPGA